MKLEFFWDVSSPYTYLASTQLDGLVERTRVEVVYRPFFLGGVFKSASNSMPGANPYKAQYMMKDLERWREDYGVKMLLPAKEVVFPINSIKAMRVACALQDTHAGPYMRAIMDEYWVKGNDVSEVEHIRSAIVAAGADPDSTLERAQAQDVKDLLRKNSDEAVERGAFGAPTLFVGEDMYWGNDRLEMLEKRLRTA